MAYRINGRATRYEEKLLRTIDTKNPVLLDKSPAELLKQWHTTGPSLAFSDLYLLRKKWFEKDGWSAFNGDQAKLFDELHAEYSTVAVIDGATEGAFEKPTFGIKPSVQATRDEDASRDNSHKVFDKIPSRYEASPDRAYPPDDILTVYDGVNRSQSPATCAAILNHWRTRYPEKEYPESRVNGTAIIPEPWTPPRGKTPTRHSASVDELNPLLLYRDYQAFKEAVQTNFFLGDNESHQEREDGDAPIIVRDIERELETRPSVEEIQAILSDHPDLAQLRDVFWFNETDYDLSNPFSKYRNEITHYMSGGRWRKAIDRFGTPLGPKVTSKGTASSKNVTKLKPHARSQNEQRARERWKRLGHLDTPPALPPPSMTLNEARVFCGLPPKPANDNVKSAMWEAPQPDRMVSNGKTGQINRSQTSQAMSAGGGPEDILLQKEKRKNFAKAVSELTSEDTQVFESAVYAANFAQVGSETGDAYKGKKTQERNGQRRARQASANLAATLAKYAA